MGGWGTMEGCWGAREGGGRAGGGGEGAGGGGGGGGGEGVWVSGMRRGLVAERLGCRVLRNVLVCVTGQASYRTFLLIAVSCASVRTPYCIGTWFIFLRNEWKSHRTHIRRYATGAAQAVQTHPNGCASA